VIGNQKPALWGDLINLLNDPGIQFLQFGDIGFSVPGIFPYPFRIDLDQAVADIFYIGNDVDRIQPEVRITVIIMTVILTIFLMGMSLILVMFLLILVMLIFILMEVSFVMFMVTFFSSPVYQSSGCLNQDEISAGIQKHFIQSLFKAKPV
jgi:hypothetical protein